MAAQLVHVWIDGHAPDERYGQRGENDRVLRCVVLDGNGYVEHSTDVHDLLGRLSCLLFHQLKPATLTSDETTRRDNSD